MLILFIGGVFVLLVLEMIFDHQKDMLRLKQGVKLENEDEKDECTSRDREDTDVK